MHCPAAIEPISGSVKARMPTLLRRVIAKGLASAAVALLLTLTFDRAGPCYPCVDQAEGWVSAL